MKKKFTKNFLLCLLIIGTASHVFAQRFSAASGNWNDVNTWSTTLGGAGGASVPTSSDDVRIAGSHTVTVDGTGGTCAALTVFGILNVDQNLSVTTFSISDKTITIAATKILTSTTNGTSTVGNSMGNASELINNGTINFSTGGAAFTVKASAKLTNNGSITKTAGGVITFEANSTVTNNGTISKTGAGAPINVFAGTYNGTGSYSAVQNSTNLVFNNTGTIAPGASPGTLKFSTGYTNTGTLNIEINGTTAGTQFDVLDVIGGTATINGTINANFGIAPTAGQRFKVVNATTYAAGSVTVIETPSSITASYDATTGEIVIDAVLPVELSKFEVKKNQKSAILTWATASEKDNAQFNIQHSTNGVDFTTIGTVKGQGTKAATTTYNYEHSTPSVGTNYYRLAQVDFNGITTYSAVKSATFGKGGLAVKSTLVQDFVTVVTTDESTPLSIFNITGQQVLQIKVQGEQNINVGHLSSGLYFIRSVTGDVARFIKE
jgi:hypothetical protein